MKHKIVVITGCTGSGKTTFAHELSLEAVLHPVGLVPLVLNAGSSLDEISSTTGTISKIGIVSSDRMRDSLLFIVDGVYTNTHLHMLKRVGELFVVRMNVPSSVLDGIPNMRTPETLPEAQPHTLVTHTLRVVGDLRSPAASVLKQALSNG